MSFYITKASGEKELFNIKKFRRSLQRAGATSKQIDQLVTKIQKMPKLRSTKQIYEFALGVLEKENPAIAARYNLKKALMELGPTGYPFEEFVAHIFKKQGYKTQVGQIVKGWCVDHEVDVITQKGKKHYMVECKFHGSQKIKTNVKVALYIKARFDDIERKWDEDPEHGHEFHQAWIATNTKFTSEAIKYAACMNIKLIGWSYPQKNNLQSLIDRFGLHPITALTTLSRAQKKEFINDGLVLCRDTRKHEAFLKKLGFSTQKIKKLIKESEAVCKI